MVGRSRTQDQTETQEKQKDRRLDLLHRFDQAEQSRDNPVLAERRIELVR